MRWIFVALLLVPVASATYTSDITFATPAQAAGEGTLAGRAESLVHVESAILLPEQSFDWQLFRTTRPVFDDLLDARPETAEQVVGDGRGRAPIQAQSNQWSTIRLGSSECSLELDADLRLHGLAAPAAKALGPSASSFPATRDPAWGSGAAFELGAQQSQWTCTSGFIEFYGFDVDLGDRVISTGSTRTTNQAMVDVIQFDHLRVELPDLRFAIDGQHEGFLTVVEPGWSWNGTLVLPLASGSITAEQGQVAADGSWRFEGVAEMHQLSETDDGRLQANVASDTPAIVNSQPVFLESVAAPVVATTLIGTAVALLGKYAFTALFTRLPPEEALKHPRRKALQDYIEANPGATFRELIRETDIPAGTCRHHLSVLQRSELIVEHRHRQTVRFFENHGKFDNTWQTVVALREPEMEQLHGLIAERPGLMQKEILDTAVNEWGWSRSTTQHRLERLAANEVLSIEHMGRRKLYSVASAKPARPSGLYGQMPT